MIITERSTEMSPQYARPFSRLILAACLSVTAFAASADTLLIDAINNVPPNDASGLPRPSNGQTMQMVLARFGEPKEKLAPVGTPPITRWVYDRFTVYFEHKLVVNSAVHLGPEQ
jgi:hypothetical protein